VTAGVPLSSLKVGERLDPERVHLDIEQLAESIRRHGLIPPLATTAERDILDGARRHAALQLLAQQGHVVPALTRVMATAKDEQARLDIEYEANAQARPWSLQARWEYYRRCKAREQEAARERMAEGGRRGKGGPDGPPLKRGRAEEVAAEAAGLSRTSARRLDAVMTAVEANPELAPLRDELVRTENINAVHRKLQRALAAGGKVHDPDSYCSQRWLLDGIHAVEPSGIALDPCSNELARRLGFVRAAVSWTIDDDARAQPTWRVLEVDGLYVVFFQPPYSSPDTGDEAKGLPGLTTKLCTEWDAERIDRVYALVKDDASTDWWGKLRDRAALLVKPRERLDHVIGVDDDGREIEHEGSNFNSAMLVLGRGTRAELLDLWSRLGEAYEGRADVYLAPSVRRAPSATAARPTGEPATVLGALKAARTSLVHARHLARHQQAGIEDIGSPEDSAIGEALRAVNVAARTVTHPPRKPRP